MHSFSTYSQEPPVQRPPLIAKSNINSKLFTICSFVFTYAEIKSNTVLGSQHNYITVSTVDIINIMKSYPFNPKCCVLACFIGVNHFSYLLNMVKLYPLCFMGQVCIKENAYFL